MRGEREATAEEGGAGEEASPVRRWMREPETPRTWCAHCGAETPLTRAYPLTAEYTTPVDLDRATTLSSTLHLHPVRRTPAWTHVRAGRAEEGEADPRRVARIAHTWLGYACTRAHAQAALAAVRAEP